MICKRIIRAAHGLFTDQREALATFGGPPLYRHTGGVTLDGGQDFCPPGLAPDFKAPA